MLYFSRWKAIGILAIALIVCLFAVPNFFDPATVAGWPAWAQRHLVLGLDLQGGSHILLQVDAADVKRQKYETLRDDVRRVLRDAKVGYTGLAIRGDGVEVRIRGDQDFNLALSKLRELSVPVGGLLGATGQRSIDVTDAGNRLIRLVVTDAAMTERIRQVVEQAVPIIEKRINGLGLVEPTIQRQGVDRILVQVPGLSDPQRLLDVIGKTAKLEFRMVDTSMSAQDALAGRAPPDSEILYEGRKDPKTPILVQKQVLVSGDELIDAQPGFDQRTSEPIVTFRFNTSGARKFAAVTQENVGRPFAIVLDNEVITAPVIRDAILTGNGQISGNFTVESANDLAILLRAGALPARLTPIEQRV
ncbi:MAG: SecDF P1 head subdomain-containing protein, partial [Xanthobacteraceae bacterium]